MKAAVLHQIGHPLSLEDVSVPEIGPEEVLVHTRACGICGTDLHIRDGWGYTPNLPFIMGHEPAGVVAEVGSKVSGFKAGDPVVPNIFFACGNCFYCRTNRETQCINLDGVLGVLKHSGGYGEYFGIPGRQLFHLPAHVPFTEGSIIADAVVTSVHAVKRARIRQGETVMVISVGGCSAAAIQICKSYGARVICVVRSSEKLKRAIELGADEALNSREIDVPAAAKDLTDGLGVDCVIDGVGNEETLKEGVNSLCHGGRLIILGYTQDRYPLDPRQVAVHELEVIGTRSGGRQDTVESIRFVANKQWKPIVTDIFPIDKVEAAHRFMREARSLGRIVLIHQ
jgi:D-arabinose 1-dehydrogenase-like Zn-dependent alcohol dehydrogenase